jgi:hypothetical protein
MGYIKIVREKPYEIIINTVKLHHADTIHLHRVYTDMTKRNVLARDAMFYHNLLDAFEGSDDVAAFKLFDIFKKHNVLVDADRLEGNIKVLKQIYDKINTETRKLIRDVIIAHKLQPRLTK